VKRMFLNLLKSWHALTADDQGHTTHAVIPAGRHEVERIPNPRGHGGYWLVLKGTKTGCSEELWRQKVTIKEKSA